MPITDVAIRLRSGKEGNRIGYDSAADLLDEIAAKDAIIRERDKEIATLRTDRHDELATLRTNLAAARGALESVKPFLDAQSDKSDRQHVRMRAFELSLQIDAALKDTAHD